MGRWIAVAILGALSLQPMSAVLADSYGAIALLPNGRAATASVWGDERAYVFGGTSWVNVNNVVSFDPGTNAASVVAPLPRSFRWSAAVWDDSTATAYLLGGSGTGDIVAYTPADNRVVHHPSQLPVRSLAGSAWSSGSVLLFGGLGTGTGPGTSHRDEILRFTPATWNVSLDTVRLPTAVSGMMAANVGDRILLFGGETAVAGAPYLKDVMSYDPLTHTLTELPVDLPGGLCCGTALYDGGRYVFLFGGGSPQRTDAILRFDIEANTFMTLPQRLPTGRVYTSGVVDGQGHLYVFGGKEGDVGGAENGPSNEIYLLSLSPGAPVDLRAGESGISHVTLTWSHTSAADTYPTNAFDVYRGASSADRTLVGTSSAREFTDASYPRGIPQTYWVVARNEVSESEPADITLSGPEAPTGLRATETAPVRVTLTWTRATGGHPASYFDVYRGNTTADAAFLGTTASTSWVDTQYPVGYSQTYFIRAGNLFGTSAPTSTSVGPPTVPTRLQAAEAAPARVTLWWARGVGGDPASHFDVYRGNTTADAAFLGTTASTSWVDTQYPVGYSQTYFIRAGNLFGTSAPASISIESPEAPQDLTVTNRVTFLRISWESVPHAVKYRIVRSTDSVESTLGETVSTTFDDDGCTDATACTYRVWSVGLPADSGPSPRASWPETCLSASLKCIV